MQKRLSLFVAAILAVTAFAGAPQASAATEFGSGCAATEFEAELNAVSLTHGAASPLPVIAPVSGVITEWKVNAKFEGVPPSEVAEYQRALQQRLEVLKSAGTDTFTVVGESMGGPLANLVGVNSYPARIPVQAGDFVGLGGSADTIFCESTDEAESIGYFYGGSPLGSTIKVTPDPKFQVPVVAKIEPDVDGDGYGDETQDKCPQSAAYQTECPVVTISSKALVPGKKAVTVEVTTSLAAPVGVTATVDLGKGKTATLVAAAKTVAPGTFAPFTLTFAKKVTKALAKLSKRKSLTMSITASATNVAGTVSNSTSTVKLRGRAKPGSSAGGKKKSHGHGKSGKSGKKSRKQ